jgi:hypothetical protein
LPPRVKLLGLILAFTYKGEFMHWQSINTPPVDDEYCLVCADGAMACRSWNSKKRTWEDPTHAQNPNVLEEYITHWMPLPPSPEIHIDQQG